MSITTDGDVLLRYPAKIVSVRLDGEAAGLSAAPCAVFSPLCHSAPLPGVTMFSLRARAGNNQYMH